MPRIPRKTSRGKPKRSARAKPQLSEQQQWHKVKQDAINRAAAKNPDAARRLLEFLERGED
ncbi:MAG TPA: hypothetical protein VJH23_04460 [archaeon]|nr:hypothetical protein [archaeon]